ncbi:MAG: hypothetical protein K0S90_385 [Enterobacteriaceae bacterium]|jgi:hypothetical protein|nr:hypothetical protein [Enterobacteriaceae bacterium]
MELSRLRLVLYRLFAVRANRLTLDNKPQQ